MTVALLRTISLGYLLLPSIIFAATWFRIELAIPMIVGYCYLFWLEIKQTKSETATSILNNKEVLALAFVAVIWAFLTGVGGYAYQVEDYVAHNAKFYDLWKNDWPTYFKEVDRYACYYFGYYMVPSFLSKVLGHLSPLSQLVWTALGLFVAVAWVWVLIGRSKFGLLIFITIGSFGHLVSILYHRFSGVPFLASGFFLDIWPVFTQSQWAPNQLIVALISSSILLYSILNNRNILQDFFLLTLCFLWGIFPSVVLLLLFSIVFLKNNIKNIKTVLLQSDLITNVILPGILFIPVFLYLTSTDYTSESNMISGFIGKFQPTREIAIEFCCGIFLNLMAFYVLILLLKPNFISKWFINLTFIGFLFASLFRIGFFNDWLLRAQLPFMILIVIIVIRSFTEFRKNSTIKSIKLYICLVFFITTSIPSLSHIYRGFVHNEIVDVVSGKDNFKSMPFDTYPNSYQYLNNFYEKYYKGAASQYLGKKNSIYEAYLSPTHQ